MDHTHRIDPIALTMLSEREARLSLADALDVLADRIREYVLGRVSRDDLYLSEMAAHRAQANLQRVLARAL